jgi:hypothetical protein
LTFTTELKVPPEPAFAKLVEAFTADAAQRSDLASDRARAIVAAVRRGFEIIVKQKLVAACDALHLVASCTPAYLQLSLIERGVPVDDAFARRDPDWNQIGAEVDAAHWICHGTGGSELRLKVSRPLGADAPQARTVTNESSVALAPAQEYTIRRFREGDAAGVARAFYQTYGYAYDLAAVYVPSRLAELNRSGRYLSLVAVGANGEIVGHYALAREEGSPVADACGAIVLPEHRGRNLLNRLRDAAELEAIELGLAAYYSEPVTDHPRTQSASESFGAKACGITLGEAPRNFLARQMELTATAQRQSCMLYIKPLGPRKTRQVFMPPRHRKMIEHIYARLELPISAGEGLTPKGRGAFRSSIVRGDRIATIDVDTIGKETATLLSQAVKDLRRVHGLGAIYVSLSLEDPGAPALCESVESLGFFFAGVGPWMLDGKDALRLQLPLTPIDLCALVVVGDFGKVLLDYIAAERDHRAGAEARATALTASSKNVRQTGN